MRVRAVTPLIRERAFEAERHRKPDDDVIEALKATGVFRSFVPERFGGYEIGMDLYVDLGVCVSEACASTGWITTFYMEHNWQFSSFCDEAQRELRPVQCRVRPFPSSLDCANLSRSLLQLLSFFCSPSCSI